MDERLQALRAEHDELAERILKKDRSGYLAKANDQDIERFEQIQRELAEAHGEPTDESDPPSADDVPDVEVTETGETNEPAVGENPHLSLEMRNRIEGVAGLYTLIDGLEHIESDLQEACEQCRTASPEYRRAVNQYSQAVTHCRGLRAALRNVVHEQEQAARRIRDREAHKAKHGQR